MELLIAKAAASELEVAPGSAHVKQNAPTSRGVTSKADYRVHVEKAIAPVR
jgi:hypothetical protein